MIPYRLIRSPAGDGSFVGAITRPVPDMPAHLCELAGRRDPEAPADRVVQFIAADEGATNHGMPQFSFRRWRQWTMRPGAPLLAPVDGEEHTIGRVTRLALHTPRDIPNTVGRCVTGEATLNQSLLATVFYHATGEGLIDCVCAIVCTNAEQPGAVITRAAIAAVRLDAQATAGNPRARILRATLEQKFQAED